MFDTYLIYVFFSLDDDDVVVIRKKLKFISLRFATDFLNFFENSLVHYRSVTVLVMVSVIV